MNGVDREFLRDEARATVRRPVVKAEIVWAGRDLDDAEVFIGVTDIDSAPYPFWGNGKGDNRVSAPQQVVKGIGLRRKWWFVETETPHGNPASPAALEWPRCELMGEDSEVAADTFVLMPDVIGSSLGGQSFLWGGPEDRYYPNNSTGGNGIDAGGYMVGWRGGQVITKILDGWAPARNQISDWLGLFDDNNIPRLTMTFTPTEVSEVVLAGDSAMGEYPVDFDIAVKVGDATADTIIVRGNDQLTYRGSFSQSVSNATGLDIRIWRWNKAGSFVKITQAFDRIAATYNGHEIVTMSVLEESDGAVGVLPVGNISSNELDLSLQNVDDKYFRGNTASQFNMLARFGRRVEPYFGFKDSAGKEVYAAKGVYWTGDWNIPEQGDAASTTGIDRLGLMQDIEYNGERGFQEVEVIAERTYWENVTLYDVAWQVLTWLRNASAPMADLEFSLDLRLKDIIIPMAFFDRQPFFDVVKRIAEAGSCFAYMDYPTDTEKEAAAIRGNERCADILRIKGFDYFGPSDAIVNAPIAETFDKRDYTTKTPTMRRDDVVNIITVPYQAYVLGEAGVPEKSGDEMIISRGVRASMAEFGRKDFSMPANALIQTVELAMEIADNTLRMFSGAPITADIETFGDVTRQIGDVVNLPEYLKGAINTRGYYALTKIQTEYGDGLRQNITCRRLGDAD